MDTMEKIKAALAACGISLWRINKTEQQSVEMFFVKKQLDTRRAKTVTKYSVTVFRNGGTEEKPLRGTASAELLASMTPEEMQSILQDTYASAAYALNPMFALPAPAVGQKGPAANTLAQQPLVESAGQLAAALFAADNRESAFLNSAELFVSRTSYHILSSEGTDASWVSTKAEGEFVVQCKEPQDVELYNQFSYDTCDCAALQARVEEALTFVKDRAIAQSVLKSGKYDVILSGNSLAAVLEYYMQRSSANMVYAGYSSWKPGECVQGEATGELLDMTLCATAPYSEEGIPMQDRTLLRSGQLQMLHGSNRFCRYLSIEPTGNYHRIQCENAGTVSFAEMKKTPCLWVVAFSDFNMNVFTGAFGGEIRLAYLIEGDRVTPVTGGSVNGNWLQAQTRLQLTYERYSSAQYTGPYAARLQDVSVAGTSDN